MIVSQNKEYRTRSGFEVEIYAIYPNQPFPVHGAYKKEVDRVWYSTAWAIDGKYHPATNMENCLDLVEIPIMSTKLGAAFEAMDRARSSCDSTNLQEIRIATGQAFVKALLEGMAEDPLLDRNQNIGYQAALRQVLIRVGIPQQ